MRPSRHALLLALLLAGCATVAPPPPPPPPPPVAAPAAPIPVPPLGPSAELKLPAMQRFTLSNGLAVRLVEYHRLPIVAIHLVLLEGGAARDPARLPGLASFTAAMVTEGTLTRSAIQLSEELGFLGASLSAGAGMDAAFVSGHTLSRHLPKVLELLGDVVANPAFPAGDFARVQDQRKVSLLQQRDQPGAIASKTFGKIFWGDHPYGHWAGGTEESVAATTRADLAGFHAARWRPGASELVVVGDVDADSLRAALEKALAGWKGAEPAGRPAEEARVGGRRAVLL
jgi:zinc protease